MTPLLTGTEIDRKASNDPGAPETELQSSSITNIGLEVLQRENVRLRLERDRARRLLEELWSSWSWRATIPVRTILSFMGVRLNPHESIADAEEAAAEQARAAEVAAIEAAVKASMARAAAEATSSGAATWDRAEDGLGARGRYGNPQRANWAALEKGIDILCFANIDWDARFQRPQQMMKQFADAGHRVFYVIPSANCLPPAPYSITQVAEGVHQVVLRCRQLQDCYQAQLSDTTCEDYLQSLAELKKEYGIGSAISVVHLPFWEPLVQALRAQDGSKIVYDCMDEWIDFPGIGQRLIEAEERLVRDADLVTVTAEALLRKWSPVNRRVVLVRNGVDVDFFTRACVPNDLVKVSGPVLGFYGALAEWVDFPLLAEIARRRPDWTLVLVGDVFVNSLAGLDDLPNVLLLGRRPFEEMPAFLFKFDVCLIPFVVNQVTQAVDPVKLYEYLSVGKPVVSVPLQEMAAYNEHVYFASGASAFVEQIERALVEDDPPRVQRRIALARNNVWRLRFEVTIDAVRELYPLVSIIIVSYNNESYTRHCIDSLYREASYPNIEILVVDNGSIDGSQKYLRWLAGQRKNVRIILNADNRGFAAANNQGIQQARGEYLVLLNNDTVVSRGWLEPLLRQLGDHSVGMVGPVTNSVGNEARVDVDYDDLIDMPDFAVRNARRMAGRSFDITMLAMFCVALRRETFDVIGPLDEAFGIGLFEDDDYSRRIQQAGFRTVCVEDAFVHHHGQASFKKLIASGEYQTLWDRNQAYFESKWGAWIPHVPRELEDRPSDLQLAPVESQPSQAEVSKARTAEHWSKHAADSDAFSPRMYWLALPAVMERHQRKACAGKHYSEWVSYCLGEFVGQRLPLTRVLSVGCGSGALERQLFLAGAFRQADAFDLADGALEHARKNALAIGATNINYVLQDIEQIDLRADYYDAVFFNGSLHHIEQLERVCEQMVIALKEDGWLFFNEYVGANFFHFGKDQVAAIHATYDLIPEQYRYSFDPRNAGSIQDQITLPDPDAVREVEPTEAIRSQDILKVVAEHFEIVACNPCGGSILQFLLHGIAGNFREEDPVSMAVLQRLMDEEDRLLDEGRIASDFVVVAARPRKVS